MSNNLRLDLYMVSKSIASSRERAKSLIKAGLVYVNNQQVLKPSQIICDNDNVVLKKDFDFVSRGGYKLKKAIEVFSIDLNSKICLDVGASTGGFTDCMLQNKAAKVYAVDVGTCQLATKLKEDKRVISLENTNIRSLDADLIKDKPHFAAIDVSFISLELVLPIVYNLLVENGHVLCLLKPQFEAGRFNVSKKGVINSKSLHVKIIKNIIKASYSIGFEVLNLSYSPIKGRQGNIEYLLYAKKSDAASDLNLASFNIANLVDLAHNNLKSQPKERQI